MLFYTDQPGRASMIWVTFKWGNGVRGTGGLVVTWAKSFLVQKDSQGKGPCGRSILDMFAKWLEGLDDVIEGTRERIRGRSSMRTGGQIRKIPVGHCEDAGFSEEQDWCFE